MRELGAHLRQVRLERGEDLDDIAQQLRIKPAYLAGIEEGDLSALPGRTYALGFLRTYAEHLGFDGNDLVVRIKASVGELTDRTRLRIRAPMPESRLPKAPIIVLSLVLVVAIYAGWSYRDRDRPVVVETVAEVPSELRADDPETGPDAPDVVGPKAPAESGKADGGAALAPASPALTPATASAPGTPAPAGADGSAPPVSREAASAKVRLATAGAKRDGLEPEAGPDRAPDHAAQVADGADATGDASVLRSAAPARASGTPTDAATVLALLPDLGATGRDGAPQVYEAGNTGARVILRARAPSWLQVSSAARDYAWTGTLQAGDALLVPNRNGLRLWTGNAGGLEIYVDGVRLPPIGPDGAVMKDIALDPKALRARAGPAAGAGGGP